MKRTTQDILNPLRKLNVWERFATFPDEPDRPGEYQALISWQESAPVSSLMSHDGKREALGTGTTEQDAAISALKLFHASLTGHIAGLESLLARVQSSLDKGTES